MAIARGRGRPCSSRLESIQSLLRRRNGKAFACGWKSRSVEEMLLSTCGTPKRASPSTKYCKEAILFHANGAHERTTHRRLFLFFPSPSFLSFFRVWSLPWPSFRAMALDAPTIEGGPAKPYTSLRLGSPRTVPAGPKHDQFET